MLTGNITARFAPFSFANSIPRNTASLCPAMTTCPGELKLAGSSDEFPDCCVTSWHIVMIFSSFNPNMAAIPPTLSGTACCIACARKRTRESASAKESASAATSALYSPKL